MTIIQDIEAACEKFREANNAEPMRVYLGKAQAKAIHEYMHKHARDLRAEARANLKIPAGNNWHYTQVDSELRVE